MWWCPRRRLTRTRCSTKRSSPTIRWCTSSPSAATGRRARWTGLPHRAARARGRPPAGSTVTMVTYGGLVGVRPGGRPGCRGHPGVGPGGHRPAHARPPRLRHRGRVGAHGRGGASWRTRPRARWAWVRRSLPAPGGAVLAPGGARPAGHRIRHPLSARPPRGRLAARRRSPARHRRALRWRYWTVPERRRRSELLVPDLGEGLEEATIVALARGDRGRRRAGPATVRRGNGQG